MSSTTYRFETWDVFTRSRFAGNPLAVVFDADRMSDSDMLAITREFNYSESVFILRPRDPEAGASVRIFTPAGELPFAGHPTVGAACAIARRDGLDQSLVLELPAGQFPIRLDRDGVASFAEFENPNLPRVHSDGPDPGQVEAALGLPAGSVDAGPERPRRAGAGIDFIYARAPLDVVRNARLDPVAWARLDIGATCGLHLYADSGSGSDATWHVRMFGPHIGVPEDPATGSAAAGLPAQLHAAGKLDNGIHDWTVEQGVEMGRPSRIRVHVDVAESTIRAVRIGGYAVPVMSGTLTI